MTAPKDQQTVANQAEGLAEQAVSGIKALSPADKSWVAAFVLVVLIIVGADAWTGVHQVKQSTAASDRLTSYLIEVEQNRSDALERQAQFFDNQVRRSQEVIRDLADAVARDSERAGIAALSAIEKQSDALVTESAVNARRQAPEPGDPDFIGPLEDD